MSVQVLRRAAFAATGSSALIASGLIFRDMSDFSQFLYKPRRTPLMNTYRRRHEICAASLISTAANTAVYFSNPKAVGLPRIGWAAINAASLGMLFAGYINPELMMRARNKDALYVTTCQASKILNPNELVVVTHYGTDEEPKAFPDSQIMRPHVARVGVDADGVPASIAFCGLTGTGIVYRTPPLRCGVEREFVPLMQLENNLVLLDKTTGHIGHQINGLDETKLLEAMGSTSYDDVGRRPSEAELERLGVKPATEVPSWRMTVGNYVRTYPFGKVFINDYKEYPDWKMPVLTLYDKIIDVIFDVVISYHNRSAKPVFPTIENVDPRLPTKQRVWGFNVGDDFVAITEDYVREGKNNVRNFTVGGQPLVASYDDNAECLGIWIRPSDRPISQAVDVNGKIGGEGESLQRLNSVKNGLFWFVWQNFFPQTDVNPVDSCED